MCRGQGVSYRYVCFYTYYSESFTQRNLPLVCFERVTQVVLSLATKDQSNAANNDIAVRDSHVECDNFDSLAINGEPESTGVTTFVQEACEAVSVLGRHYVPSQLAVEQSEFQDLKEYFRRPRMIFNAAIPTGTRGRVSTNGFLITPSQLFTGYFPAGLSRLTGVYGVRFKLVFTLQVAATPFHQGILCLSWQYGRINNGSYARFLYSATATNLPHVRLDLSTDTMVQLTIPFLDVREFMPLLDGEYDYGLCGLNTITAVPTVSGLVPPSCRLYLHLEDMELVGANPQFTANVTLQAGKTTSPVEREFEQEAYPLSSGVASLSRTLRWISKGIPSISSIAGPASWFLAKGAGAIRSFGYSKPLVQDPFVRTVRMGTVGENNVDTPAVGVMVGPMASNHLAITPAFGGSDVDEMSLRYVLSQYCQVSYGAFTTTTPNVATLYACNVSPSSMWFRAIATAPHCNVGPRTAVIGNSNAFIPSGLYYFSTMFRYWRGGLKFRFTFSKTKFHGGRVLVTFVPRYGNQTNVPAPNPAGTALGPEIAAGNAQPFGYSAIFDLRDGNVFDFPVPYVAPVCWAHIYDTIGSVTMTVVDPLQAPGVVSSTINFLVEVAGADDFELSVPIGPLQPAYTQTIDVINQSGKMTSTISSDASQYTIGEAITSVKQLIQIPWTTAVKAVAPGSTVAQHIFPWFYHGPQIVTIPNTTPAAPNTFTFGGNIALCYVFARGSTDVHLYSMETKDSPLSIWTAFASVVRGQAPATTSSPNNRPGASMPRVFKGNGDPMHLRFPAYQVTQRFLSHCLNLVTWTANWANSATDLAVFPADTGNPGCVPKVWVANYGSQAGAIRLSRCAGDDAMLAQYIGPPPMLLDNAAGAVYDPDSVQNQ